MVGGFIIFAAPTYKSTSTPKTGASPFNGGLHQRQGQSPSTGSFSDRFLINSPAVSAAQNTHTQAVIFEVAKAVLAALDQLHFAVKATLRLEPPRGYNINLLQ